MADKKEKKEEKSNRFTYESDKGLTVVSKGKKEETKKPEEK